MRIGRHLGVSGHPNLEESGVAEAEKDRDVPLIDLKPCLPVGIDSPDGQLNAPSFHSDIVGLLALVLLHLCSVDRQSHIWLMPISLSFKDAPKYGMAHSPPHPTPLNNINRHTISRHTSDVVKVPLETLQLDLAVQVLPSEHAQLLSVLQRAWNLDRPRPVHVVEALAVDQLLNHSFLQG